MDFPIDCTWVRLLIDTLREGINLVVTTNYEFVTRTKLVKKFFLGNYRMHGSRRLILQSYSPLEAESF